MSPVVLLRERTDRSCALGRDHEVNIRLFMATSRISSCHRPGKRSIGLKSPTPDCSPNTERKNCCVRRPSRNVSAAAAKVSRDRTEEFVKPVRNGATGVLCAANEEVQDALRQVYVFVRHASPSASTEEDNNILIGM